MAKPLPPQTQAALDMIRAYHTAYGKMPTIQEVANHLGIAMTGAYEKILRLQRYGYVTKVSERGWYRYDLNEP